MIDRELLTDLQYCLIEPPDGGDTWPSLIWTRDEVLDAVNAGLRALVHDTHLQVARSELSITAGTQSIALPADWLATAHLVWRDTATSVRTPLGPADAFEADLAAPGWEMAAGLPLGYADLDGPTLTLRLVPTPLADGVLELLYVAVPPLLDGSGADLPVASEFASGVKYAALASLLRKVGRLIDPERAAYCERRYELTTTVSGILLEGWS